MASTDPVRSVCVLGMHRSGTSVAARDVNLLGVGLGPPEQLMGPGPDNPRGYFERRDVKELDDEVLAALGGSWDRPPVLVAGWEHDPTLDRFRDRATTILAELDRSVADDEATGASGERVVGWKDPRLCLLLPFWASLRPIAATVLVVRDPIEVIASLQARNGFDEAHGALLWLRYNLSAVRADPDTLVVRHHDLFSRTDDVLTAMASHLGVAQPSASVRQQAHEHLEPTLRHNVAGTVGSRSQQPLVALADEVWAEGDVELDRLGTGVSTALAQGWLRSPTDDDALTAARAQVVDLTERLRKSNRARRAMTPPDADSVTGGAR